MESGKCDEKAEELIIHKHLKLKHCRDVHHLLKKGNRQASAQQWRTKAVNDFFSFTTSDARRFHDIDIVIQTSNGFPWCLIVVN